MKSTKKQQNARTQESLEKYEETQAEIEQLLKEIKAGLQVHDRTASGNGGHHWGYVGDLRHIAGELRDISNRLHSKGEYEKVDNS
jgi:hypothetical protein